MNKLPIRIPAIVASPAHTPSDTVRMHVHRCKVVQRRQRYVAIEASLKPRGLTPFNVTPFNGRVGIEPLKICRLNLMFQKIINMSCANNW
jgi:hypothetical protein